MAANTFGFYHVVVIKDMKESFDGKHPNDHADMWPENTRLWKPRGSRRVSWVRVGSRISWKMMRVFDHVFLIKRTGQIHSSSMSHVACFLHLHNRKWFNLWRKMPSQKDVGDVRWLYYFTTCSLGWTEDELRKHLRSDLYISPRTFQEMAMKKIWKNNQTNKRLVSVIRHVVSSEGCWRTSLGLPETWSHSSIAVALLIRSVSWWKVNLQFCSRATLHSAFPLFWPCFSSLPLRRWTDFNFCLRIGSCLDPPPRPDCWISEVAALPAGSPISLKLCSSSWSPPWLKHLNLGTELDWMITWKSPVDSKLPFHNTGAFCAHGNI